ncbi:uncharacterized protein LOC144105202 [Amblyomma americanum]
MEGSMSLSKTWNFLRHLLNPENSKTQSGIRLAKARHALEGNDDDFMNKLTETYVGETSRTKLPNYGGAPNEALDAPITEAEVRAEIGDLWPHEMVVFRPHLGTQDVMIQIKHDIIDSRSKYAKAILGLDLTKAFDNVKHEAVLERLNKVNISARTYRYIRDFLTGITACVKFQTLESPEIELGSKGTP